MKEIESKSFALCLTLFFLRSSVLNHSAGEHNDLQALAQSIISYTAALRVGTQHMSFSLCVCRGYWVEAFVSRFAGKAGGGK